MIRRDFTRLAAAAAAVGGVAAPASAPQARYEGHGRPPLRWPIRYSMQISGTDPRTLAFAKQLGMEYVSAHRAGRSGVRLIPGNSGRFVW